MASAANGAEVAVPAVDIAASRPAAGPATSASRFVDPSAPGAVDRFSPDQVAALAAPLDRANVRSRSQGGQTLSYIEGWVVIAEANRIFGFDGWARETVELRCVSQSERCVGRQQKSGWGVTYIARLRIRAGNVLRDGCGAGHGIDADLGIAHESAIKEAETDAMKRALMTFGNPFGLALYDKDQRHVSGGTAPSANAAMRRGAPSTARATAPHPSTTAATPGMDRDQLAAKAISVIKSSGLTATGMRHLLDELGGPHATGIGQLPDETLGRLVRVGLSSVTVARWNADPEAAATPPPALHPETTHA